MNTYTGQSKMDSFINSNIYMTRFTENGSSYLNFFSKRKVTPNIDRYDFYFSVKKGATRMEKLQPFLVNTTFVEVNIFGSSFVGCTCTYNLLGQSPYSQPTIHRFPIGHVQNLLTGNTVYGISQLPLLRTGSTPVYFQT